MMAKIAWSVFDVVVFTIFLWLGSLSYLLVHEFGHAFFALIFNGCPINIHIGNTDGFNNRMYGRLSYLLVSYRRDICGKLAVLGASPQVSCGFVAKQSKKVA